MDLRLVGAVEGGILQEGLQLDGDKTTQHIPDKLAPFG